MDEYIEGYIFVRPATSQFYFISSKNKNITPILSRKHVYFVYKFWVGKFVHKKYVEPRMYKRRLDVINNVSEKLIYVCKNGMLLTRDFQICIDELLGGSCSGART